MSYFGHNIRRQDSLENTVMLGKWKVAGKEEEQKYYDWIAGVGGSGEG